MSALALPARATALLAPPLRWLRLAWKLAPILLLAALLVTRGTLERVKAEHKTRIAGIVAGAAIADRDAARRGEAAANLYAERTAALQPLILRSKDTVTRYAETPAGRVRCLGAERVRGLDELDTTLFTPPDPAGAARAVQPDAGAPPARRLDDQR